jgi:aromatic-amino-acid transaminase
MVGVQTVGGTGALRIGCDLLYAAGARRMLLPTPSWPNHPPIIARAGLALVQTPFFDVAAQVIDLDRVLRDLTTLSPGDAILLQTSCHNPLGADFSLAHWRRLGEALRAQQIVPLLDVAYQGLGDGLEEDSAGLRLMLELVPEAVVAASGAKIFGIYRERVGAVYAKCAPGARTALVSHLNSIARASYSMPPDHGAAVVRTVLSDPALRAEWRAELDHMRARINTRRAALSCIAVRGMTLAPIASQKGMFSTLPLSAAQIEALRTQHGVYVTDAGRINVAGLGDSDTRRFADALSAVADIR